MAGEGMWRPALPGISRVGRYWIECEIGRGGMGAVHLASSRGPEGFKKLVAIKTLLPALDDGERFVRMLRDEARVASALTHPNIVQLYDLGQDGELPFLVMEYVHGESLASIGRFLGRVPDRLAVEIACQVLDALAYAAQPGLALVHRDLSPQNILVTYDGVPKLVDFGIARAAVRLGRTETGVVKGRFHYMPPEQRQGRPVDARADLYALGVVLYEATVGRHPFEGSDGTPAEVPRPAAELRDDYPPALFEIIRRATALDREARFPDAATMLAALRELATTLGPPVTRQELGALLREPFAERRRAKEEIIAKGEIAARPTEELGLADTEFHSTGPPAPAPPQATPPAPQAVAPQLTKRRRRRAALAALGAVALVGLGALAWTARRDRGAGGPRALVPLAPVHPAALVLCVRADEHLGLDEQRAAWVVVRLVAAGLERAPGVAPVHAYRVLDDVGWSDEGGQRQRRACASEGATVDVLVGAGAGGRARLELDGTSTLLPPGLGAGARAALLQVSTRLGIAPVPTVPDEDDASLRRLLETREFFYFTWGEQQRKHFEAAIRERPELEEPYVLEALNRWWTGGLDRAETRALRRPPHASVRTSALLDAVLALEEDRCADAARLAQLALEDRRYREDPIALYLLGEALFHGGRPVEGARTFERALAAEPQLLVVTHHLFEHLVATGDFAGAQALAARWQRIAPTDFHAQQFHAFAALGAGDYATAQELFEALIDRVASADPTAQPLTQVGLVYARALAGDLAGAFRRAEEVSETSDDPSVVAPETAAFALSVWSHDAQAATRWAGRIRAKLAAPEAWNNINLHVLGYSVALADLLAGNLEARRVWLTGATPERMARRYRFAALASALDIMEAYARHDGAALARLAEATAEASLAHLAAGLRAELDGRNDAAADELEAALGSSGNGELDCLAAAALGRVRRAMGDVPGATAACARVLAPRVPRPYCVLLWDACGKPAPAAAPR